MPTYDFYDWIRRKLYNDAWWERAIDLAPDAPARKVRKVVEKLLDPGGRGLR